MTLRAHPPSWPRGRARGEGPPRRPGETSRLTLVREGRRQVVAVELGERPPEAPSRP